LRLVVCTWPKNHLVQVFAGAILNNVRDIMESQDSVATISFNQVKVCIVNDDGSAPCPKYPGCVGLKAEYDPEGMTVRFIDLANGSSLQDFLVSKAVESARIGNRAIVFHLEGETIMICFDDATHCRKFHAMVAQIRSEKAISVFKQRTEDSSATQYFQFYGYLSQQQNMMQDFVRTSTYQRAILSNLTDFRDKTILDVGAGSGILSFFAQQAGAKRVYAVEGSSIAKHAESLVKHNKVDNVIKVISGKIEEIELPEKVDMIISEPMGYMLLNERMLETYLHAKKWLKPDGKMFPSRGDLHIAPFTDEALYMEQVNKVNFWYQDFFHGVNLSSLREAAMNEYFRQPIVDTFDIRICLAKTQRHVIDFATADETELHRIEIPLEFHILQSGTVHGLAFWFDVAFIGTGATVWLSTAPTEPLTHWYQVRCLLKQPIFAKEGQVLTGRVLMVANTKQSYDVTIECMIMGTRTKSTNSLDLKNPYFRYTGVTPPPPPGENNQSPSEAYWTTVDLQGARQAVNLVNGMIVDGLGHVSLDSGTNTNVATNVQQHANNALSQANIHQGSIPATGRKSQPSVPMSAANSLQFNQLIGGAISPSVISSQQQQNGTSNSISSSAPSTAVAAGSPISQANQHLMIGDYVQGNAMGNVYRQN